MALHDRTCIVCGNPLTRGRKYCSYTCCGKARQHMRQCAVCGQMFPTPPSSVKVTCSQACSSALRRSRHEHGTYDTATEMMRTAARSSPVLQRDEHHVNAKEWVICAPNGEVYRCRNLLNWLREHEHMLDGTPRQAWDGITKIKYSMQGKRQRPNKSWKGWTLLEWGE